MVLKIIILLTNPYKKYEKNRNSNKRNEYRRC